MPDTGHLDHPSQDTSDRFRDDAFLRRMGYAIACRPRVGPPLWRSPGGRVMTQAEATQEAQALLASAGRQH